MRICLGCIAGAAALRLVVGSYGWNPGLFTPCRFDALAVGALLALAARGPGGIAGWPRKATACVLATLVVACPLYVLKTGQGDLSVQVVKYTFAALLYGALLVIAVAARPESPIGRFFHARPLRGLGKYSYGLYVYHPFMIALFEAFFSPQQGGALAPLPAGMLAP